MSKTLALALSASTSPAFPFPAALDDCTRAFAYLKEYAAEWGCDSSQVSVGGDSAGSALRSLPPVLIVSAGHDILFDQTRCFAERLQRLDHPLEYHVYPTAMHLFITVPGQPTAFRNAVETVARFLND